MGTHGYSWVLSGYSWVLMGSQWVLRLCIFGFSRGSQAGTLPLSSTACEELLVEGLLPGDGLTVVSHVPFSPACLIWRNVPCQRATPVDHTALLKDKSGSRPGP